MLSLCQCGCGKEVTREGNKYLNGHNSYTIQSRLKMSKLRIGKKHTEESKLKISKGNTKKLVSLETRLKMSNSGGSWIGRKHTTQTKLKMSDSQKGRKHSPESKLKMSLSAIKYVNNHLKDGKVIRPNIGKNEKFILDQLQNSISIEIIRNNLDIAHIIGKFPDGFISKHNLVVEVLEPHHFKANNELIKYDQNRELLIASRLGCMIYYISEQEFLTNPEKEIERFKEFVHVLESETDMVKSC
jgi:hypothetical protein